MDLKSQKKIAARLLKCGNTKIWIDPSRVADVSEAITARDISSLIKDGVIKAKYKQGVSRSRARKITGQKRKGRRRNRGSKRGSSGTRTPRKKAWINKIRIVREVLRELRDNEKISKNTYRALYKKASGGTFKSRKFLLSYLEKEKIIDKETAEKTIIDVIEKRRIRFGKRK
jgi:large subunit ribosomal protein L19e